MFDDALDILGPGVAFGAGRSRGLGQDVISVAGAGARVLLVADPGVAAAGLAEPIEAALAQSAIAFQVFTDVRSDPLATQIDGAAAAARSFGATLIIGLEIGRAHV